MELYFLLAVVFLVGGFLAGWVGLGGGIMIAPLLLYVPPAAGLSPLDMKDLAQVLYQLLKRLEEIPVQSHAVIGEFTNPSDKVVEIAQ